MLPQHNPSSVADPPRALYMNGKFGNVDDLTFLPAVFRGPLVGFTDSKHLHVKNANHLGQLLTDDEIEQLPCARESDVFRMAA
jgi:hypothetical protein